MNDTPRAFPEGHTGLQQKMATTQQALGVAAPSLTVSHTALRPRTVRPPCPCPQVCATGEKLKCAQHKSPQEADPLQARGILAEPQLSTYLSIYLSDI